MNRIAMIAAAASVLIAFSASIGGTSEINPGTVEAAVLDATTYTRSESVLWSFGGGDDGQAPRTNLIADGWGHLYGTTQGGGANAVTDTEVIGPNGGTAFELSPPAGHQTQWREKVLWSFGASA